MGKAPGIEYTVARHFTLRDFDSLPGYWLFLMSYAYRTASHDHHVSRRSLPAPPPHLDLDDAYRFTLDQRTPVVTVVLFF